MGNYLSVGEVARRLKYPPRLVTDILYRQLVDTSQCPMLGGRRMIPAEMLPELKEALKTRTRHGEALAHVG
jgi:hypothetical protein